MLKARRHAPQKMMRRTARVFLNDLNPGKARTLREFLRLCHDASQYFIDLFWQRKDFSAKLADLETVHRGRDRFGLTTRLAQALAKQAKECVRSAHANKRRKPRLRRHIVTLYAHFVKIEPFRGKGFEWAICLTGSGAPRMIIPCKSTAPIQKFLADGWQMARTLRLGRRNDRLFVDVLFEKPSPPLRTEGRIVGMDSNYKNGLVLSDGQVTGQRLYPLLQSFGKQQKHTYTEVKSLLGQALKQLDCSTIRTLCIEDLKRVKHHKRGTFPRVLNRRLSHWLYAYTAAWLSRYCEAQGIRLERKSPWKTSQFCHLCRRWDRRNRVGDKFCCVHCGFSEDADLNAARNLALLGEAGVYGLRSLQSSKPCAV